MSFKFFLATIAASSGIALASATPSFAYEGGDCTTSHACHVLSAGRERGRTPTWCISIPFEKKGSGEIAMFVLRHFDPDRIQDLDAQIAEPGNLIFADSKITGPNDDFCRGPTYLAGAGAVVLCDKKFGSGWIMGESLQYAIKHGRPPNDQPVHVGRF